MNTYLIPTTAVYCYEPYDHIYLVYANTPLEAYRKAQTELQGEYIPQKSQKCKNAIAKHYITLYNDIKLIRDVSRTETRCYKKKVRVIW